MMPAATIILLIVVLAAVFAFIEASADDNIIDTASAKLDRKKFHFLGFTRRAFVICAAVLVHFGFAPIALSTISLAGTSFWLVFEVIISYKIKGSIFFVGSSANTDVLMRRAAFLMNLDAEEVKMLVMLMTFCIAVVIASTQFVAL